ncbi:CoA-binding protein [Lederbergia galactosidilytica]|uniref:CoA-binding protein n=1 Tax=Lederbergia galactosidilytica TaxID=217031 RepID=A0A177ZW69_9BACI|nr:CoA-binding protein [Lederbergia galactosidilytica]OAK72151.1 CoA-binding protein [Lederbergia galactosidilytica]
MSIQNPDREQIAEILHNAKRIAVVGLSNQPNRTSYSVAKAMKDSGYEIIPVNPTVDEVFGIKAVPSLKEINGHVDIVNIFRRPEHLPELARDFSEINADVFWAQLGIENQEAYDFLTEKGYTVIMNRCIKVEHAMTKEK